MIELLSDPYPGVREAARLALVRLSRGNDFGPLSTAVGTQVSQAQEHWRSWFNLQTALRKPGSAHASD